MKFSLLIDRVWLRFCRHMRERAMKRALKTLFESRGEDSYALRCLIEHALGRRMNKPLLMRLWSALFDEERPIGRDRELL